MKVKWQRHFQALAKGLGCIALLAVIYAVHTTFDGAYSGQISAVILFVTALWALITLDWKIDVLREQLGVENLHPGGAVREGFATIGLGHGDQKPIDPKHDQSRPPPRSGSGVKDGTLLCWRVFADFATVANEMFYHTPWRLQELGNSEVGDDGTAYGRRYSIYFGPNVAGLLLISDGQFSLTNPEVVVSYEIRRARTYSSDDLRTFSGWMTGLLLAGREKESADQIRMEMMDAMWQIESVALRNPDIRFRMKGEAKRYITEAKSRAKAA